MNLTIIYYTSNREDESFESEIRKELLKNCGDLPIVSVSQKPIDLGKNICVGDVGASNINTKKQILIGLEEAKTENVCMAEADFLYPPEYFKFVPERKDTIYYLDNLFVLWSNRNRFHRKRNSDGALVCNRIYLKDRLYEALQNAPEWFDGRDEPEYEGKLKHNTVLYRGRRVPFTTGIPAVTFKTGNGVSWRCPHVRKTYRTSLTHWGTAEALNRRFNEFV
jgi:hypothetical protein